LLLAICSRLSCCTFIQQLLCAAPFVCFPAREVTLHLTRTWCLRCHLQPSCRATAGPRLTCLSALVEAVLALACQLCVNVRVGSAAPTEWSLLQV
jgi:hypothetical protein